MTPRKIVLFTSFGLFAASPIAIKLWTNYVCHYYPPQHVFYNENDWACIPIALLFCFDCFLLFLIVVCGKGWLLRFNYMLFGLIALDLILVIAYGAMMKIRAAG